MTALRPGSVLLHAWRHPRANGTDITSDSRHNADGRRGAGSAQASRHAVPTGSRCIGHTDLPVDPRRAKRLAHRIRRLARHSGLPRIVLTSPLARCRDVGRWLARWGWRHEVHAALAELHFGDWDGRPWAAVPQLAIDAWCADFAQHRPGGHGEPVAALLQRVRGFDPGPARIVVTHGGWLSAAAWRAAHGDTLPSSTHWPPAPAHGTRCDFGWTASA